MDPEQHRQALARLESDYLRGALSAEEYERLRARLVESDPPETATVAASYDVAEPTASSSSTVAPAEGDPVAGVELASWGRRAAAWLIDGVLVGSILVLVVAWAATNGTATADVLVAVAALFAGPVYQWLMTGKWGQTLGKMALAIKVLRAEDEGQIGYGRSFARVVSIAVLALIPILLLLAYLWPLWDGRNQTLYDKMVGTIVVRTP